MSRLVLAFASTLVLLAAAAALVHAPHTVAEVPLAAPFEGVPARIGGWTESASVPTDLLPADRLATRHLLRGYQRGTVTVLVSVDYYSSQTQRRRPPAQQLLYPGRGWTDLSAVAVSVPLDTHSPRAIPATLLFMRVGERQLAILYWYQVGARAIASDHWYRAVLLYNRLIHRRSEGALVRIATPLDGAADASSAMGRLTPFVQAFYPEALAALPR